MYAIATPSENYILDTIWSTQVDGNYFPELNKYSFTMPENKITVNVTFDLTIGMDKQESKFMQIFPVPCKDMFYITDNNNLVKNVSIFDMRGKMIKSFSNMSNEKAYSVSDFSNGLYIVKVTTDDYTITKRIAIH